MLPWRGRLLFKESIPEKAHKYGLKIDKVAATNGYTWNLMVYPSEQDPMAGLGHAQIVVIN